MILYKHFQIFMTATCVCILLLTSCNSDPKPIENNSEMDTASTDTMKTILFYGNSITAGFGLEEEEAFPGRIQQKIDSLDLPYRVINGGLSGETTASGLSRLDWYLEEEPAIFFLELGGNDGLRGIPLSETKKNLRQMLDNVGEKYPNTIRILAGMEIPPNMGPEYTAEFRNIYPEIAREYPDVIYIPFLLKGVAGDRDLNLPDGIHPTAEGHRIITANIWPYLKPIVMSEQ